VEDICFKYKKGDQQDGFEIGPVNLEVKHGETLFIIGGNGSGKTTLAMLLTGLYEPHQGSILINEKKVTGSQLSEYFSAVFNPLFLFDKLYNIDVQGKSEQLKKYLKLLNLDEKVEVSGNQYSTINLSGGQRKRLALLQCYLEDSPIYLFDEWAADQDPEYRNFFYRTLLPEMKKAGKIVIAITHDDHYFDVADKVVKMHMGRLEIYTDETLPASGFTSVAL
jgi:ABC-type siderophore export system fused ATPase/permease subunit